jgi:cold shock CspA family protein
MGRSRSRQSSAASLHGRSERTVPPKHTFPPITAGVLRRGGGWCRFWVLVRMDGGALSGAAEEPNAMNVPLEITFHGIAKSDAIESLIRQQAAKLEKVCPHLSSCRIAIEKPHEHARAGNPYRVRIDMRVPPSHELVAVRDPLDGVLHDSLQTVVLETFRVARRQLKALVDRQRREIKTHDQPCAIVIRLFPDKGYGFLQTPDGRELYFHGHSVLHGDFARLRVGTAVRFDEEQGDDGPQASTVQIVETGAGVPDPPPRVAARLR